MLSGAAALSHQLLWTQRVTDLLGSSVESSTRVFGCFFLGLSIRAGLIALYVARITRPWRAMAIAEIGVAILCLPVLWLATEITPSAALQRSRVKSIEIVELTGMVVEAADEFFSDYNAGITQSSSAQIVVEDGRVCVAFQVNKYDGLIEGLFLPW